MVRVELEITSPADLLERLYPNGRIGGLTVDGKVPGALGEPVLLEVKLQRRLLSVKGQLAWARRQSSMHFKESFGIDLSPDDESAGRLLAFSRQELGPESFRANPRWITNLPVTLTVATDKRRETLVDLSLGGAFVRSATPLPPETHVKLTVRPPRRLFAITLEGRVTFARQTGITGMGVSFTEAPQQVEKKLSDFLKRLSSGRR